MAIRCTGVRTLNPIPPGSIRPALRNAAPPQYARGRRRRNPDRAANKLPISALDQKRRQEGLAVTSGLPRLAGHVRVRSHFASGPSLCENS
jgi:hypothetical protein